MSETPEHTGTAFAISNGFQLCKGDTYSRTNLVFQLDAIMQKKEHLFENEYTHL